VCELNLLPDVTTCLQYSSLAQNIAALHLQLVVLYNFDSQALSYGILPSG
jgi:hypothetical protein